MKHPKQHINYLIYNRSAACIHKGDSHRASDKCQFPTFISSVEEGLKAFHDKGIGGLGQLAEQKAPALGQAAQDPGDGRDPVPVRDRSEGLRSKLHFDNLFPLNLPLRLLCRVWRTHLCRRQRRPSTARILPGSSAPFAGLLPLRPRSRHRHTRFPRPFPFVPLSSSPHTILAPRFSGNFNRLYPGQRTADPPLLRLLQQQGPRKTTPPARGCGNPR